MLRVLPWSKNRPSTRAPAQPGRRAHPRLRMQFGPGGRPARGTGSAGARRPGLHAGGAGAQPGGARRHGSGLPRAPRGRRGPVRGLVPHRRRRGPRLGALRSSRRAGPGRHRSSERGRRRRPARAPGAHPRPAPRHPRAAGAPLRGREAHRPAGRNIRPLVHRPLRPGDLPGRRRLRRPGRGVAAAMMNEDAHAAILLALGALALRLGLTDAHLAYIRPAMGPVLALAGAVLVLLGAGVLLGPRHRPGQAPNAVPTRDGHDHTGTSGVAWLLVAPILAIAVVVPRPLGAFAANRAAATLPAPTRTDFGPLPAPAAPGDPVVLSLKEFVGRAVYDRGRSLQGTPVRLVGFVTPDTRGG